MLLRHALTRSGWDAALVDAMAGAYAGHVRLQPDELRRIGAAMRIRELWLAAWRYWAKTMAGKPPTGSEWWLPRRAHTDAVVAVAQTAFARHPEH